MVRNFEWEGPKMKKKILYHPFGNAFGDVKRRHHWNDVITDFLNFDFVIISLKNHNLAKSRNFRSPKSKDKGRWGFSELGAESPQRLAIFDDLLL